MKKLCAIALLVCVAAVAARGEVVRFSQVRDAKAGEGINLFGVVTHVFPGGDGAFVMASNVHYDLDGLLVLPPEDGTPLEGAQNLEEGETIVLHGVIEKRETRSVARGARVLRTGKMPLEPPPILRMGDFRKGWRHLRRHRLPGIVVSCVSESGTADSILWLGIGGTRAGVPVVVHGGISGAAAEPGALVEVTGLVVNKFDDEGRTISARLDVASASNVRLVASVPTDWRLVGAIVLGMALAATLLTLAVFWLKVRRERHAARIIAEERRRMAADLHDTIEQHLAGVKMLLTAALDAPGVPDGVRRDVERAEDMLVYAKGEVRAAVMDLRGDGAGETLAAALKGVAAGLGGAGAVTFRYALRGLPEHLPPVRARNLLMIVREAVTNAVKHGRAKTIAMVADSIEDFGFKTSDIVSMAGAGNPRSEVRSPKSRGFVLRVLNDGVPFDRAAALGPSTGHYGLAGMEERARQGNFTLSFGWEDRWSFVKVEVGL